MKTRFENLSGFSFDDVRVHYNSDKPSQLQALAFTQGSQVYVGTGQEKHLGHELGHVVQQKVNRVTPITHINSNPVNDSPILEAEADRLANLHSTAEIGAARYSNQSNFKINYSPYIVQRMPIAAFNSKITDADQNRAAATTKIDMVNDVRISVSMASPPITRRVLAVVACSGDNYTVCGSKARKEGSSFVPDETYTDNYGQNFQQKVAAYCGIPYREPTYLHAEIKMMEIEPTLNKSIGVSSKMCHSCQTTFRGAAYKANKPLFVNDGTSRVFFKNIEKVIATPLTGGTKVCDNCGTVYGNDKKDECPHHSITPTLSVTPSVGVSGFGSFPSEDGTSSQSTFTSSSTLISPKPLSLSSSPSVTSPVSSFSLTGLSPQSKKVGLPPPPKGFHLHTHSSPSSSLSSTHTGSSYQAPHTIPTPTHTISPSISPSHEPTFNFQNAFIQIYPNLANEGMPLPSYSFEAAYAFFTQNIPIQCHGVSLTDQKTIYEWCTECHVAYVFGRM